MLGLAHRGWELDDYGQHWVHPLRAAGYHSALIGEQHISVDPDVIGYDDVIELEPTTPGRSLRSPSRRSDRARAVLPLGRLFRDPPELRGSDLGARRLYSLPPPNLPDTPRTRHDMAAFKASVRSLDQGIGAVLNGLHEHGLAERTPDHLHDRPRARLPGGQGDPVRSRDRRDAPDPRARRLHRGQGLRRDGQPPRHLSDDLRPRRDRPAGVAPGRVADAPGPWRGGRASTTQCSPR